MIVMVDNCAPILTGQGKALLKDFLALPLPRAA
jgi:hypothetical protein